MNRKVKEGKKKKSEKIRRKRKKKKKKIKKKVLCERGVVEGVEGWGAGQKSNKKKRGAGRSGGGGGKRTKKIERKSREDVKIGGREVAGSGVGRVCGLGELSWVFCGGFVRGGL